MGEFLTESLRQQNWPRCVVPVIISWQLEPEVEPRRASLVATEVREVDEEEEPETLTDGGDGGRVGGVPRRRY